MMDGVLIIDKPAGPTSHDVVSEVKSILSAKKVGHLGTLDPAASGVLPLVINSATKFAKKLSGRAKVYEFDLVLGAKTDTDDDQGKVVAKAPIPENILDLIDGIKSKFTGEILQAPPDYSAVKVGGRPLYKMARKGKPVSSEPRVVRIDELEVLVHRGTERVRMRVRCSAGTYVRALCRDIGDAAGSYGHASNIRRLQSGPYIIEDAITLDAFKELAAPDKLKRIKPLTSLAIS